jgi:hypothetical protein
VAPSLKRAFVSAAVVALVVSVLPAAAQDAVKAGPRHYKVVFENDQVRVLHITYGPGGPARLERTKVVAAAEQPEAAAGPCKLSN